MLVPAQAGIQSKIITANQADIPDPQPRVPQAWSDTTHSCYQQPTLDTVPAVLGLDFKVAQSRLQFLVRGLARYLRKLDDCIAQCRQPTTHCHCIQAEAG